MKSIPLWFLFISGGSLVLLGLLQIRERPRKPGDTIYKRFVNVGTLWSLICIVVGGLILANALGFLDTKPSETGPKPTRGRRR